MADSFGISDDNFDDSALVAASRWTSGGNSAAARRARVKAQRRDKYGRWAEMGGGVSFQGKMSDGSTKTVIGRYIGPAKREGYMRVEVTDPKSGVKVGVYEVNGKVATVSKAILTGQQLEEAGVKLDVNGNRIGENLDRDVEKFDVMFQDVAPDEVETALTGKGLSDDEKKVEAKARLDAKPYVSYNVVDENGNPIADAQTPAKAQQPPQAPQGVSENRSENMTLYVGRDGSINPFQVVAIGNGKGWQVVRNTGGGADDRIISTHPDRERAEVAARAIIFTEPPKAQAQAQLPPEGPGGPDGPSGPGGPRGAVAVQKLAKDVDLGDQLIDTTAIESDEERRHVAGFVERIVYDDEYGTATFLINKGNNPDGSPNKVAITRRLMTPMGVDPQTSPNGGNNLSVEGNAAYERYMARRNPPQAQTPPSTPTATPTPSEPSKAQIPPSTPGVAPSSSPRFLTREAQINRDTLTASQRTALNNLLKYKSDSLEALNTAGMRAIDTESYKVQYAIVERLVDSINDLADNSAKGTPEDAFFFKGDQESRIENMRILPSSIKTAIATDPKLPPGTSVITEARGIIVSKSGKPYLVTYKDGSGARVYNIKNGVPDLTYEVGSCSTGTSFVSGGRNSSNRENHLPDDGSIGMIQVGREADKQEGLGGYLIMMNRFVTQSHGRRFSHSNNLYPPGNVYGKQVSKNLEDQHRFQRDKALFAQAPDAPIIAALRGTPELQYGPNHWASVEEVLRRRLGGGENQSALWEIGQTINGIADQFRSDFKDDPNAQPGVDYPAIFERHVKSENPDWTDHDFQMQLLRTAYKEGMSQDEILAKLDEYIALGESNTTWPRLLGDRLVNKITALRNSIAAADWSGYERKSEPAGLITEKVKFWNSPFGREKDFTNFIVPKGTTPVRVGPGYSHRPAGAAPKGSHVNWTENPAELATRFSSDELVEALKTAILNKTNDVSLDFGFNTKDKVNSAAVYRALTEQGQDAPKILADIYDQALGEGRTDNIDALNKYRAGLRDINDEFAEILNQYGVERPAEFSKINGRFSESNLTLFADVVRRIAADENANSNIRMSPLTTVNEPRMFADGVTLDKNPYNPVMSPQEWIVNGVTDDPKILAYNFSTEGLNNALSNAISRSSRYVNLQFANNQTLNIRIEAIRDTLQRQGVNTEAIFDNHSTYFREMPGVLERMPGGLQGALDQDGNLVYELRVNGNSNKKITGKFARNITNMDQDGFSYTLIQNFDGVDTPLAKIQRNAQGNYDVWYKTPFDQAPTITCDDKSVAAGNISNALTADKMFNDNFSHIENMNGGGFGAHARQALRNKKVIGESNEESPADRPDLSRRITYTIAGNEQVLPQNKKSVSFEASADGNSYKLFSEGESLGSVAKQGNFFVVKSHEDAPVGTYSSLSDALSRLNLGASEKLSLAQGTLFSVGIEQNQLRGQLILNQNTDLGKLSIGTGRGTIAIPRPDADGSLKRTAVGRFANFANREFELVGYTNNKKAGRYTAGDRFEFLNLSFYNKEDSPSANRKPAIFGRVYRTGRSEWASQIQFEDGTGFTKYTRANDPLRATDILKEMLADKGILNDDVKFDEIVPKRTKDATADDKANYNPPAPPAPAPAPAPAAPVAPAAPIDPAAIDAARQAYALQPQDLVASPIDVDRVNRILDRINNNIPDLSGANAAQAQRLGGGITAPAFLTLPNGLKIKVKTYDGRWYQTPDDQTERLNINDVAVSAFADLLGVNATPGGFALINGKKIIGDPIEPNVDRYGWQDIIGSRQLRENPVNAQAVQDYKNIVVFNTLVGGGDWLHHHGNFLVVKNPADGTRRLAICDGGRALIGGVVRREPENSIFMAPVRQVRTQYLKDFMAPGAGPEVMKSGAQQGVITRDEFIQIAREKVLPLTPEVIARFAEIYQNPRDRRKFIDNLTRRRAELLDYLQIDDVRDRQAPLNVPAAPAQPSVPAAPSTPTARSVRPRAPRVPAPLGTDRTDNRQPLTPAQALRVENLELKIVATSRGVDYDFSTGDDGKVVRTKDNTGKSYYGSMIVRADGSVAAIFNPNELGMERNGDAQLAIFRGQDAVSNAEIWLSTKLHMSTQPIQNYFAARRDNKEDLPLVGQLTQQPQLIKKGFLNPTTERQTSFARRLVEGKKMSDADRAKYRGVLNMSGLTVGEVGGIIDAIKDNEDRTASEIAESVARDQVVPANEVVDNPSDLARTSKPTGTNKRAIDLVPGDKIQFGGRVAFVHDRGNGKVDIGVVNDAGELNIVRGIDADLPIRVTPEPANNQQMVGGNNAVNNFAGVANRTLDDIKNAYQGHEVLPNGDLVIGKREFTDAAGRKTRYEAVVHRTSNETFIGYVRQLTLAPNGNVIRTRAAAFTAPAHSSVAALNRLGTLFTGDGGAGSGMNGAQPNNWFNNLNTIAEDIDPRTGQLLPVNLIPGQEFNPIGNTGIQKTGDGLKDALIAHVANLIDRGVLSDQILEQVAGAGGANFSILSRHQFMDIIERIEARRANPGLNAIPYVSRDEKTIVRVGDTVHHYDADGNRVTLPGGAEKIGKVVRRETLQVYEKAQGRYEYRDILIVKFEGRRQLTPIAARRLEVITRADGSPPLPAVNEPNAPQAPQAPQAPVAPAAPNNDPLADAFTSDPSFGPSEIDAINNQVTLPFGMEAVVSQVGGGIIITPQAGGAAIANIEPVGNGTYNVLTVNDNNSGLNITNHPTKLDAVNAMLRRITGGNQAPAAPAESPIGFAPGRSMPGISGFPEGIAVVDRTDEGTNYLDEFGNKNEIAVIAIGNGKGWQVVRNRPNQEPEVLYSGNREGAEREAVARINQEASTSPSAPATPANNVVNLPAGARVNSPEEAEAVQTLLDNEIPRNRYEVTRDSDGTKFVVISNNNLGAESFIEVRRTPNGWRAVDPRQVDQNLKTIYEGNDRRVAEMHAMNRITGADGGQNPSPEAPAPAAPLGERNIEIEGRPFRGRVSDNGNRVTFYDDSGNEAATITRQADGRTFTVSEPFGGIIGVTSSFDDAVLIAGRKIQDNIALGLMDESSVPPSSGPGTNLPPTPESSAPSDIINGADGVAYSRNRSFETTTYSSPSGTNNPLRVSTPNGVTWTVYNNGQTVTIFGTREEAEAFTENLISGQPANLPATPTPTPAPSVPAVPEVPAEPRRLNTQQVIRMREVALRDLARLEQQYPDGRGEPDVIDIDPLDGVRKALPRSEFLRRKINQYNRRLNNANQPANQQSGNVVPSQAPTSFPRSTQDPESESYIPGNSVLMPNQPDTPLPNYISEIPTSVPATPSGDTSLNALNVTLRGVKMVAQRDDTGFTTFDENGGEGAYSIANRDGTFSVYDPTTGENEVVDSEAEAVILAGAINFNNIRGGFHQPKYSSEPSAPSQPSLPTGYSRSPIGSGNSSYEVKHDTDKENTPYYLVEKGVNGNYYVNKWDSQNSAEQQRYRRPVSSELFNTKEQADQWIANDLGPSDGGNGGGGNPPSEPPTTPPAGGNFATDRIPAGMSLQDRGFLSIIGPSDLRLANDGSPLGQENRGRIYGFYGKNPNINGRYGAVVNGLPEPQQREEFDTPEQAHDWVVENLRNLAPTPAPAPAPTSSPARQAPAVPPSGTNVTEWVVDNYGDLSVDDVEEVVIGQGYTEVTQHLIDTLELKRSFENGFTEMGALPAWFGPSPPPGVVVDSNAPNGGVNPNRRVRLSDGTVGYLKRIGMGQRELFNELATARMFEALGIDDVVITSVIDPLTGDLSVLSREIPNDGLGGDFSGNPEDLKNVKEMALVDFLISNGDRHPGNWLFKGDTAYPIDHGYSHMAGPVPTDLNDFGYDASFDMRNDIGQFGNLITEWANGGRPDLFTEEEFVAIRDKVMALKDMYEASGPYFSGYFNNMIAPKLDFLMGIWR